MCGIVGFCDKTGGLTARAVVPSSTMLEALACRGPDGAGVAMIGPEPAPAAAGETWSIRIAGVNEPPLDRLAPLGRLVADARRVAPGAEARLLRFRFGPNAGVTAGDIEQALGARRGGLEVLSLGRRLDLVKQVGSPSQLEATYAVSSWTGPLAIGHTRLSTESRIDLSHSQPFWVHGAPDLATVHNGHVTNYHQLRRRYEQRGVIFYTDNDSEVIGVYLLDRMEHGLSLPEALEDSVVDLDGAFNLPGRLTDGLGVVRDRFGFKPLVLAETDDWIAVATEEIALRRLFPANTPPSSPLPARPCFFRCQESIDRLIWIFHAECRALATIEDDPLTELSPDLTTVDCGELPVRAINQAIRDAIASGSKAIHLSHPGARHNLGVGLPEGVELTIDGSVGYYVAGLNDGATVIVHGGAGWGAGESMRDGTIVIDGNVGNAVAASIRDGTVVVRGDASTRAASR